MEGSCECCISCCCCDDRASSGLVAAEQQPFGATRGAVRASWFAWPKTNGFLPPHVQLLLLLSWLPLLPPLFASRP